MSNIFGRVKGACCTTHWRSLVLKTDGLMNDDWHNNFLNMVRLVCHGLTIFSGIAFFRCGCISHGSAFFSLSSTRLLTRAYTDNKQAFTTANGWISFYKNLAVYDIWSRQNQRLMSRKGNQVALDVNNWFRFTAKLCVQLSISLSPDSIGTRLSHHLVHRSSQVAQCNTIESCTSWVPQTFNQCHKLSQTISRS